MDPDTHSDLVALYALYPASSADLTALAPACDPEFCGPAALPSWPSEDPRSPALAPPRLQIEKAYLAIATTPAWREEGVTLVTLNRYDYGGGSEEEAMDGWQREALERGTRRKFWT
ncbi:uncharacterized protein CC84DRAFT_1213361 [Paraphaeosphaeria sporulosa]|uniref:Uncharacterized protein n=1 Tax=Paraphaeosphaeria sporulosa TaxID=1460663 RepID=A0A177CT84_9PLEO|nr:uncharacterized protein CC84DRAFT_1213361 [Paraphaeosphaeria sporulosa]OAG09987.1 hypothetical protein CC84DRAFT_1213361 [Paraphaeosphaeria sporulosa]